MFLLTFFKAVFNIIVQHSDAGPKLHVPPLKILYVLSYHLPFLYHFRSHSWPFDFSPKQASNLTG